ncbi:MAG: ion transporter [Cardiobacteriaceae bacterium]|nr:ion transporter [Cardiobacteriaceae bacterium]
MLFSREKITNLVQSSLFRNGILALIVINSITIGIETLHLTGWVKTALLYFDIFAVIIYTLEAVFKIYAYRVGYFKRAWNLFDFLILLLCLIPTSLIPFPVQVARVLRVLRVFRVFRLISAFKQMRIVIEAIARAIPGVFWTALLLFIIYYVFAVIGTVMFGEKYQDWFGNLAKSFYTLFQVMTLESWSMGIARPVMEEYPWSWAYFVPFVLISSFIVVNVVVGIVLDTISQTRSEVDREEIKEKTLEDKNTALQKEISALKEHLEKIEALLVDKK